MEAHGVPGTGYIHFKVTQQSRKQCPGPAFCTGNRGPEGNEPAADHTLVKGGSRIEKGNVRADLNPSWSGGGKGKGRTPGRGCRREVPLVGRSLCALVSCVCLGGKRRAEWKERVIRNNV